MDESSPIYIYISTILRDLANCFYLITNMWFHITLENLLQVYDFDRDYKDIGIAQFTTKYFVVRNCMVNAKCDTLLSAWNTPPGK